MKLFNIGEKIKQQKIYFTFLILTTIAVIVFAVYSAVMMSGGLFALDISEVVYLQFLKKQNSFVSLLFGSLLAVAVIVALMVVCHIKKWLVPLALIFFLYYIYSQTVILISLIMIYGFLNVLILFIFYTVFLLCEFAILILIMLELWTLSGRDRYFSVCFSSSESSMVLYLMILSLLVFIFCLVLVILRKFVILLLY